MNDVSIQFIILIIMIAAFHTACKKRYEEYHKEIQDILQEIRKERKEHNEYMRKLYEDNLKQ